MTSTRSPAIVGLTPFTDLVGYYRAAVPPAIHDLMVTGINVPVHIGNATVMPGDAVFGDPGGVYFIPPSPNPATPGGGRGGRGGGQ